MNPSDPGELAIHLSALRRMARELVGRDGPWEDLVQWTLLSALERPPRVLSLAWLRCVLRNRATDHFRRREDLASGEEIEAELGPGADAMALRLEACRGLVATMERLPEAYRRVLFMRYFEDRSPLQMARVLGLPLGTVKTRLHRGLSQMRAALEREYDDEAGGWMAAMLPLAFPAWPRSGGALGRASLLSGWISNDQKRLDWFVRWSWLWWQRVSSGATGVQRRGIPGRQWGSWRSCWPAMGSLGWGSKMLAKRGGWRNRNEGVAAAKEFWQRAHRNAG